MSHEVPKTRDAAPADTESPRAMAGQFLKFAGLMTVIGASLAILRTLRVGEHHWFEGNPLFFVALLPVGFALWAGGLRLSQPRLRAPDSHEDGGGHG
jgi:hypothetical protein